MIIDTPPFHTPIWTVLRADLTKAFVLDLDVVKGVEISI